MARCKTHYYALNWDGSATCMSCGLTVVYIERHRGWWSKTDAEKLEELDRQRRREGEDKKAKA